jgi:hypothetical protein
MADLEAVNDNGLTPLQLVADEGEIECMKVI